MAGIYEVCFDMQYASGDDFDGSEEVRVAAEHGEEAVAKAREYVLSKEWDEDADPDDGVTWKAGDKIYSAARLASLKLLATSDI